LRGTFQFKIDFSEYGKLQNTETRDNRNLPVQSPFFFYFSRVLAKSAQIDLRCRPTRDVINSEADQPQTPQALVNYVHVKQGDSTMAFTQILITIGFFTSLIFTIQVLVPAKKSHPIV